MCESCCGNHNFVRELQWELGFFVQVGKNATFWEVRQFWEIRLLKSAKKVSPFSKNATFFKKRQFLTKISIRTQTGSQIVITGACYMLVMVWYLQQVGYQPLLTKNLTKALWHSSQNLRMFWVVDCSGRAVDHFGQVMVLISGEETLLRFSPSIWCPQGKDRVSLRARNFVGGSWKCPFLLFWCFCWL